MGIQELQAAQAAEATQVAALQQSMTDLGTSITAEIQRVEAAIAALGGGGQIDAVTAALNTSVTNLQTVVTTMAAAKQQLDAEQTIQVNQPGS